MLDDKMVIDEISRITGVKYSDEQRQILQHRGGMCILASAGSGKALASDTFIVTPNGYTQIGDIQIGDKVYDENGQEQSVIGVFPQGKKKIYRITFSDGNTLDCCSEHIWGVRVNNEDILNACGGTKYKGVQSDDNMRCLTTKQILEHPIYRESNGEVAKANFSIPVCKPVQFKKSSIDLGVDEIVHWVTTNVGFSKHEVNRLTKLMVADSETKIRFLNQLIDKYANICDDYYSIRFNNGLLMNLVKHICESLGLIAMCVRDYIRVYPSTTYQKLHKINDSLEYHWSQDMVKDWRDIESIEDIGESVEMVCIQVSGESEMYLADNFIPTHNTTVLTHLLAKRIKTGEIPDVSKLLCTTYSKAGSTEMEERLCALLKKIGISAKVQVKTMHASYFMILKHFGVITGKVCSNAQRTMMIQQAVKDAKLQLDDEDLQLVDSLISYQINNLMDDETLTKSYVYTLEDVPQEKYAEIRMGYNRKKQEANMIDFDDMQMLVYYLCVVQKNQAVLDFCHQWEYFFIDEFQDISKIQFEILRSWVTDPNKLIVIGDDDQCLAADTMILTSGGEKQVTEDIKSVLTPYGLGSIAESEVDGQSSSLYMHNIKEIITSTGNRLRLTPEHKIFARPKVGEAYMYLACNKEVGYYLGVTRNGCKELELTAGQVWFIKHFDNASDNDIHDYVSDMISKYSLNLDNTSDKSIRDIKAKELSIVDTAHGASEILQDFDISIDSPIKFATTRGFIDIQMFGGAKSNRGFAKTRLIFSGNHEEYSEVINNFNPDCVTKHGIDAISIEGYVDSMEKVAMDITRMCVDHKIPVRIQRSAIFSEGEKYYLLEAGSVVEGMEVPVLSENEFIGTTIVSNKNVPNYDKVYDLSIPDTRVIIANGIPVHNCIYQWRGANPNIILNICGYYDIQKFVLSTNYRCGGNIVNHAAVGIKNNDKRAEKTMVPFNSGGEIKICDSGSSNLYEMSKYAYTYILELINQRRVCPSDIAVLSRNNQHIAILNNMLFKAGVYCVATPDMQLTTSSMYKDIRAVIELVNDTYNHNLVGKTLWKLCMYMGVKGAHVFAKFMDETGCSLKDAIGYILKKILWEDIAFEKHIRVPEKVESKIAYQCSRFQRETKNSLVALYNIMCCTNEKEKIRDAFVQYLAGTEFMYKSGDRSRTINGLVSYISEMVDKDGLEDTIAFLNTTEQYESGKVVVPGDKVIMSTMHGAKGREWKYVVLFANDNVTFPSFEGICKMLEDNVSPEDISGSIDENRRLSYVAWTRAKEELIIFTDKEDISVYTLETLGILEKNGYKNNIHIIKMAQHGIPPEIIEKAKEKIFGPESPYKLEININKSEEDQVFITNGSGDSDEESDILGLDF